MRKSALILGALVLVTLSFASIAGAEATTTRIIITVPVDQIQPAGPCFGEDILIQGEFEARFRFTLTPTGSQLTDGHVAAHLTATGLSTGDTYQVINVGTTVTNAGSVEGLPPFVEVNISLSRIIGSGTNETGLSTFVFHFTVTPSGNAVEVDRSTFKCVS